VHLLQTPRLHGVLEESRIGDEIVDRLHLADVFEVVLGLARHQGLLGGGVQRSRKIAADEMIAGESRKHGWASRVIGGEEVALVCFPEAGAALATCSPGGSQFHARK